MKREDLEKLGISKEHIDQIMTWNGEDINTHKTTITSLTTERDQLKTQLGEASTAIEGFKKLNPDQLQKAADEWKTKYETATQEAANQLAKVKFDHALETALTGAKVKNVKAVSALLSTDKLKLKEDGTIEGLEDQLKPIKEKDGYLFADTKEPPVIVKGGNNTSVVGDAFDAAMRKGAGLPVKQ